MITIKRDGAIVLKRQGLTYFVLINGLNVFEVEGDLDKAVSMFNRKVADRKKVSEALKNK